MFGFGFGLMGETEVMVLLAKEGTVMFLGSSDKKIQKLKLKHDFNRATLTRLTRFYIYSASNFVPYIIRDIYIIGTAFK